MAKNLSLLKFSLAKPKVKKDSIRVSNKLVTGLCFQEDGVFKMHVIYELEDETKVMRVLELTPDSYDLKGREVVFDAKPILNKYGKLVRGMHVRRERTFKYGYGLPSQYTTVCEGHEFNGYLVRVGVEKKLMFKLNRWIRKYNEYNTDDSE